MLYPFKRFDFIGLLVTGIFLLANAAFGKPSLMLLPGASYDSIPEPKIVTDSLKKLTKLDSLAGYEPVESVSQALDTTSAILIHTQDSLVNAIHTKLDSINNAVDARVNGGAAPLFDFRDSLKNGVQGVSQKLDNLNGIPEKKLLSSEPVQNVQQKFDHMDVTALPIKDPEVLPVPETGLLNEMDAGFPTEFNVSEELTTPVGNQTSPELNLPEEVKKPMESVQQNPLNELTEFDQLNKIKSQINEVSGVDQKISGYNEELTKVKQGDLTGLEKTMEESVVGQMDGLDQFQQNKQALGQVKEQFSYKPALDKEGLRKRFEEFASKAPEDEVVKHFTELKQSFDKTTGLKQKYDHVPSVKNFDKRQYEYLKNVPWFRKLMPGVELEMMVANEVVSLDVAPYIGYQLHRKLDVQLGYILRYNVNKDDVLDIRNDKFYGWRAGASLKVFKAFEFMSLYERRQADVWIDDQYVRYRYAEFFLGIKRTYNISKRIHGNAQILFNVLHDSSGAYSNPFNLRLGLLLSQGKGVTRRREGAKKSEQSARGAM